MLKKFFILFLALCATLCGCNGYRETNQGLFVTAICFEAVDEGYNSAIEIIYSLENESNTAREVLYSSAATPALCMAQFKSSLSRELYFEHCGAVIVNDSASDSQIHQLVDYCKTQGINLSSFVVVTSDLKQLLEASGFSGNTGFDIMTLMKKLRVESRMSFSNRIYEAEYAQSHSGKCALPKLCVKQGKICISGERIYQKGNEENDQTA